VTHALTHIIILSPSLLYVRYSGGIVICPFSSLSKFVIVFFFVIIIICHLVELLLLLLLRLFFIIVIVIIVIIIYFLLGLVILGSVAAFFGARLASFASSALGQVFICIMMLFGTIFPNSVEPDLFPIFPIIVLLVFSRSCHVLLCRC
jgi:hypothetical protein